MQSNSKLTPEQKQELKAMKAEFFKAGGVIFSGDNGVTVAIVRTGARAGKFSVSIASNDEKKNRPKVGAYVALMRFFDYQNLPVLLVMKDAPLYATDGDYLQEVAYDIAQAVTQG